ncbi:hypothetical protein AKO1_003240, partial [Acrasis kona]
MFNVVEFKRRQLEKRGPIMSIEEIHAHYNKAAATSKQKYRINITVQSDWVQDDWSADTTHINNLNSTSTNNTNPSPTVSSPTSPTSPTLDPSSSSSGKKKHFSFFLECQLSQGKKKTRNPHKFKVADEKDQQAWITALTQAIL